MRIFYDTEFLERGPHFPITLVSIGMVAEDGRELYEVNGDLDLECQAYLRTDPWLKPNVWEHLPRHSRHLAGDLIHDLIDITHPHVTSFRTIAEEVAAFCAVGLEEGEKAELWAYYADYDHVLLSQLFGRMIDLPAHMPMYTRDIKQAADHFDVALHDITNGGEHHALADAKWVREAFKAVEWRLLTGDHFWIDL